MRKPWNSQNSPHLFNARPREVDPRSGPRPSRSSINSAPLCGAGVTWLASSGVPTPPRKKKTVYLTTRRQSPAESAALFVEYRGDVTFQEACLQSRDVNSGVLLPSRWIDLQRPPSALLIIPFEICY